MSLNIIDVYKSRKWKSFSVSNSLQPHGLQPTRLLCPWDFLGKSTGVGCHCLFLREVFIEPFNFSFFSITDGASVQFSSVQSLTQSCPTVCNPMNHSTPGLLVHHHPPEFAQTLVYRVGDAIQPSHPLLSPFPLAPNPSEHQSLFQGVNSSHEVAKVLEFQL